MTLTSTAAAAEISPVSVGPQLHRWPVYCRRGPATRRGQPERREPLVPGTPLGGGRRRRAGSRGSSDRWGARAREPFSFGGWNESKFGVGDITGRGCIEFWTKAKKTTTKWNREAGTKWMA